MGRPPHCSGPRLRLEGAYCGSQAPSSLEVAVRKAVSEKGRATEPPPMINMDRGRGGGSLVVGRGGKL